MITASGVLSINKFLAGAAGDWAGTLAVGLLGTTTTASTTASLQYEIARYPITLKSYIPTSASNKLVLRTSLEPDLVAKIYEVGVFPTTQDNNDNLDHTPITDFSEIDSSGSTTWLYQTGSVATVVSTYSRAGKYDVRIASGSTTYNTGLTISSDGYYDTDYLNMLYFVSSATTGTSSVTVNLVDDLGTAWTASGTFPATSSGNWNVLSMNFNTKDVDFNDNITTASISFAAAAGTILADHLKFLKNYSKDETQLLAARQATSVSASPYINKVAGQSAEVEYTIQVT